MKEKQAESRPSSHFNHSAKITERKIDKKKPPSFKKIAWVIGLVLLAGVSIQWGRSYLAGGISSPFPSSSPKSTPAPKTQAQVIAVAKNFACACEGCGELPLAQCECDMPRGALEEKQFIREKLAEGNTVEQVIDLLDKRYGHRL